MALNEANWSMTPYEFIKTLGTSSDVVLILGSGAPDGNSSPQEDAAKGSLYIRDDAGTDESALYIKVDSAGSDDDWAPVLIAGEIVTGGRTWATDWTMATDKKIYLRDSGIYLYSSADGVLHLVADGSVRVGDGTNEAIFAPDGELTLAATARVTRSLQFTPGSWTGGGQGVGTGDYGGISFGIGGANGVVFRVPEDADLTANLSVKLHWYINEAYVTGSGEVQFACAYSAAPADETEAADGAGYTGDLDPGDQNIPATAKYLTVTTLGTLTGTSLAVGDIVGLDFSRVALDDGSDPTADPVAILLTVDYTANKLGAAT